VKSPRPQDIDMSRLSLDELKTLVAEAKRLLEVRRFEEGLRQAVDDYQSRSPEVIRF